jgi:hypothetical protein
VAARGPSQKVELAVPVQQPMQKKKKKRRV